MTPTRILENDHLCEPVDVLRAGTLLCGRFMITRLIAATSCNDVYLGHDRYTWQMVAIKRLATTPRSGAPPYIQALGWFHQEVRLLSSMCHAQLPGVIAAFRDHTGHYVVMEYIEGVTLANLLERSRASLNLALAVADGLCDVVAYLHQQTTPIIHADIKPGNVILARDGRVVLLDLGLARPRDALCGANQPAGTPPYTPPEQWQGLPLNERSDIYAMGVLFCELLGASASSTAIQEVLVRATAPSPRDRFTSVEHLRQALRQATQPRPAPTRRARSSSVVLRAIWMALVIVIVIGLRCLESAAMKMNTQPIDTLEPAQHTLLVVQGAARSGAPSLVDVVATVEQYQQRRIEAIAEQDAAVLADIAGGSALASIQAVIEGQRSADAHMHITVTAFEIVAVQLLDDDRVAVVVSKLEDRLLYPAGCAVPDDMMPCRAATPVTVRGERYQVRYTLLRNAGRWVVMAWTVQS